MMYYLYTISNTIDNSKYVGITNDIQRRFREHKNGSSNKYLKVAQELFPENAFKYEIACIGTREYIDDLETKVISTYKTLGVNLYNVSNGGLIGNGSPGIEHWNASLTEQDVINIRNMYASNQITQRNLAIKYNIGYKTISKIVRGERWSCVGGPITLTKQSISKVANRRKISDDQVVEIRELAKEEYLDTNTLDISDIALVSGISRQNMKLILNGTSYKHLSGPILGVDYYREFGK